MISPEGAWSCERERTLVLVIRNLEFEQAQETHQQNQLKTLRSAHHSIVHFMTLIYSFFSKGGPEVCTSPFLQLFK